MKKSARVIVTYNCNRSCPGCCNERDHDIKQIFSEDYLMEFDEINITGGEPMLIVDKVVQLIERMQTKGYEGKFYLYTAFWDFGPSAHYLLELLDGVTYTLHAEAGMSDLIRLKTFSKEHDWMLRKTINSRLSIDKRLYDKYDFSNIDLTCWDMIKKMEWRDDCEVPDHEELIYYEL